MIAVKLFIVVILMVISVEEIYGHGMLMEPVNRSSAWRKGFKVPKNYDDDGNFCGGLNVQIKNGGKCGICGDDYALSRPRPNENTGIYGTGTIVKNLNDRYQKCQKIKAVVRITANHWGYFKFQICQLSKSKELETEECFERYPLKLEDGSDRYVLKSHDAKDYTMTLILPKNLTCEHCVLRWEYVAANNWGVCEDGSEKMGCGPQETFKTCSDITIS
ncbi:PREDICTED: uncharacterized protein LOC106790084 [Polistes canadensis]|uniref:uncharacterized protein LOC106790084 n=1 Tax=Polistes canadensis TaxID=91411 RepID=UPI000718F200|nr:PREDICTED: uncharacterized protein LOC106790084 [Polistes canadensis]